MSDLKASILRQFDELIDELGRLVEAMPDQSWDRVSMGIAYEETSSSQKDEFYRIRTRYLALLNSIPSNDKKLAVAREYARDVVPLQFNLQHVLNHMRGLRSDYEAGMLRASYSSGDFSGVAELMIREALQEAQQLQSPFHEQEIDRLEQLALRAARVGFGDDSIQYKTIYSIFHPRTIAYANLTPEDEQRLHIEKWTRIQIQIINALELMPDELRINTTKQKALDKSKQSGSSSASTEKRRLDEPTAIVIGAIITSIAVIVAAVIGIAIGQANATVSYPNDAIILTYTPLPQQFGTLEPTEEATAITLP